MDLKSLKFIEVALGEGIAQLSIKRPRALNAINAALLGELQTAFTELRNFDSLRCVILTGAGDKAFIAGADIAEMSGLSASEARKFSQAGHEVCAMIERFPTPVIGAINGYALGGGCELALACDILYASDKAKFGQPEVKLGLIPGFGATVRLPRKIGPAAAGEWIYTGEIFSAHQAQTLGLVREVLPAEDLLPRVREVAKLIAKRAPLSVRAAKRAMTEGMAMDPERAAGLEHQLFSDLFDTKDMREGTAAFLEKRDPDFKGH